MPFWLTALCLVSSALAAICLLAAVVFPERF